VSPLPPRSGERRALMVSKPPAFDRRVPHRPLSKPQAFRLSSVLSASPSTFPKTRRKGRYRTSVRLGLLRIVCRTDGATAHQHTARYAYSAAGDRQAEPLATYRQQWERLEGREPQWQQEQAKARKIERDTGLSL
jgi:hypothetical protein